MCNFLNAHEVQGFPYDTRDRAENGDLRLPNWGRGMIGSAIQKTLFSFEGSGSLVPTAAKRAPAEASVSG